VADVPKQRLLFLQLFLEFLLEAGAFLGQLQAFVQGHEWVGHKTPRRLPHDFIRRKRVVPVVSSLVEIHHARHVRVVIVVVTLEVRTDDAFELFVLLLKPGQFLLELLVALLLLLGSQDLLEEPGGQAVTQTSGSRRHLHHPLAVCIQIICALEFFQADLVEKPL